MSVTSFLAHFGLERTPFSKQIASRDLFARSAHQEAIARIHFCIGEYGLGVITGEVGVGKTDALRAALVGLDPPHHKVIYIPNPGIGVFGLYVAIVRALGAVPRLWRIDLIAQ